jgi:N-acetylmuramoyl-L-alanine amidase/Fibronectin type III domain
MGGSSSGALAAGPSLDAAMRSAALARSVPLPLVQAIAYVNSRWELTPPGGDGGVGPMHIMPAQLAQAAQLSGRTQDEISRDAAANLDAGAAMLAQAHSGGQDLAGWQPSVARLEGPYVATQVFDLLRSGVTRTLSSGETITLAPQVLPAAPTVANTGNTMSTDYPAAAWVPANPNNYTPDNRPIGDPIDMIVIHDIEGTAGSAIQHFQDPNAQASAHYVVSDAGQITQMVAEHDIAWHAGNWDYNTRSIGIEHEGYAWTPGWYTPIMYQASAGIAASICSRYGVPMDRQHVIGHNEVPDPNNPGQFGGAGHHTDPGPYWDWGYYMATAQGDAAALPSPPHMMGAITSVAGDQTLSITWPAARTCHLAVSGWDVVAQPGNLIQHLSPGATSATFTGLQNGIWYTFTVTAHNADGQDSLTTQAVPGDWSAAYNTSQVPTTWAMGHAQTFPVTVTNSGKSAWPSTGFNEVDLDLHFASYPGGSAAQQYWLSSRAFSLPSDVAPGQSVTVSVTVTPPGFGHLVLEAEMVKEHQLWFAKYAPVNVLVNAPTWSASYDVSRVPTSWVDGQPETFPVTVTNTGDFPWPSTGANEVDLDLHFASYAGGSGALQYWLSSQAFSIAADVAPGGSVTVNVTMTPPGFGHLVLEAEMIKEHEFWFSQYSPVNVLVVAPVWSASYDVSLVPTSWVMGHPQTFPVTVTNTGNQAWPSTGFTEVDLDLHFASYAGGSGAQRYWLSSQAVSLPSDVAPGQSVTINMTWSPPGFGHLVLEAEMIKEHQFWFSQYAPVNVYVASH